MFRKSLVTGIVFASILVVGKPARSPAFPMMNACTAAVAVYNNYWQSYNNCLSVLGVLQPEACYGLLYQANQALNAVYLWCNFDQV